MPQIRIRSAGEGATTGLPNTRASAEAAGAGIGRALGQAGNALSSLGADLQARQRQQEELQDRIDQARFRTDETLRLQDEVERLPENPDGFSEKYTEGLIQRGQSLLEGKSGERAQRTRLWLENFQGDQTVKAVTVESRGQAAFRRRQVTEQFDSSINTIRANPGEYDSVTADMDAVIEAMPLDGESKAGLRTAFKQDAAATRFSSLLESAATPGEVDAIANTLKNDENWRNQLSKEQYASLVNRVDTRRDQIVRLAESNAKGAILDFEARAERGEDLPPSLLDSIEQKVVAANDPVLQERYTAGRIAYETRKSLRGASPAAIRGAIDQSKQAPREYPAGTPHGQVQAAAVKYGVDPNIAMAIVQIESNFNPRAKAGTSSASGLFQFVRGTAERYGLSDPFDSAANADAGARLTRDNIEGLRRSLGREPSPGEVYLAHFLGFGGAQSLGRHSPDTPVSQFLSPEAIRANRSILEGKTVAQVRAWADSKMAKAAQAVGGFLPNAVREQTAAQVWAEQQKGLTDNPIQYASDQGVVPFTPVDFGAADGNMSFLARAETVAQIESFYGDSGVKIEKVFTDGEVTALKDVLDNGSVDQKAQALTLISDLGEYTERGLAQIGQTDPEMAYVASMLSTRDAAVATNARGILRGFELMENDPKGMGALLESSAGVKTQDVFSATVGGALMLVPGAATNAKVAADALYLSRLSRSPSKEFNEKAYQQAIKDVLGGEIVEHNGSTIVLPRGVDEPSFEAFLDNIDVQDLATISMTGQPPVYANGEPVDAEWFRDEAVFVQVGAGLYGFTNELGEMLPDATGRAYIANINATSVDIVLGRFEGSVDQR